MCGMELDHVEVGLFGIACSLDESISHSIHVVACHSTRHLIARAPCYRARRDDMPIVGIERFVHAFPTQLGRTLQARMAKLQTNPRLGLAMDEVDDAFPS